MKTYVRVIDICNDPKSTTKMGVAMGVALEFSTDVTMDAATDQVLDSLHKTGGTRTPKWIREIVFFVNTNLKADYCCLGQTVEF